MLLSTWFKTKTVINTEKEISDVIISKKIHTNNFKNGNRTICNMLRNINFLTKYKHEIKVSKLLDFVNDSVLKLRTYKQDFDSSNWWDNKEDVDSFSRSIFNNYYKTLSLEIIKIHHPVFELLNNLYTIIDDINIKNFIHEITYYTYKINLKLCEYEDIYKEKDDNIVYDKQWEIILHKVHKMKSYNPYVLYDDLSDINVVIKNGKYEYMDIRSSYDFPRKTFLDDIKKNNYDAIIELGGGTGHNIFYFSLLSDTNSSFYMGDVSPNGLNVANLIKKKFFHKKNITNIHFDYNNPDSFFENIKIRENLSNVLIITFWSIEQITNVKMELFEKMFNMFEKIDCIHLEPVGWQVSEKSIMKENKDGRRDYYNKNLYTTLLDLQQHQKISITKTDIDYFNVGPKESCGTLIKWHVWGSWK